MLELWEAPLTDLEMDLDGQNALQHVYCFFDRLCTLNLIGQQLELLADAPVGGLSFMVLEETIKLITQNFPSYLLTQIKRLYFCLPTLYRAEYCKFKTASELCEHDQVSGLFLGLIHNPSECTTILISSFNVLDRDDKNDNFPSGLLDMTDTYLTLGTLIEDMYYCTPARLEHLNRNFAAKGPPQRRNSFLGRHRNARKSSRRGSVAKLK